MYACRSLLNSGIDRHVRWLCIDSTMLAIPPPSIWSRGLSAARRVATMIRLLMIETRAAVLVFAGDGPSFVEKGVMTLLARLMGRRAILCPRSGILVDDLRRSAFFRRFVPFVFNRASVVMCQGQTWVGIFSGVGGVDPGRLRLVPNWIRCADYQDIVRTRRPGADVRTFLYMGWLEDFKGIFDLVNAVDARRTELAAARFVICGSGSRAAACRERVMQLGLEGSFEFRGWVQGAVKESALREADVLVLPSRREGMPNIVLEAMACGLPVVATAVGGVPDLVCSGVTGLLVPPEQPHELGSALVRCLRDPQAVRAWGDAALDHIKTHHDVQVLWPVVLQALRGDRDSVVQTEEASGGA